MPADRPGADAAPRGPGAQAFPCPDCGASLAFDPLRCALACAACGHARPLPPPSADERDQALREQDYLEALRRLAAREPSLEARVLDCPSCGAQMRLEGHVVGDRCAFCASPLLLDQAHVQRLLQPQAVLPFALDKSRAQQVFARWVGSRWFAPNALKHTVSRADGIHGVYVPWWTYDAQTVTTYRGERGDRRAVPEQHPGASARAGSGPRYVTDWSPAAGAVSVAFDDLLVVGSPSIPEHLARVLDRWDLQKLRPLAPELMAGFAVEAYRRGLEAGFVEARARMEPAITQAIRQDIGGDEQRIQARQTVVDGIRFKHLLLPVWIGSYRFGDRAYRVVVNGQTGEVEGDRPYSAFKIAAALLLALVVVALLALYGQAAP